MGFPAVIKPIAAAASMGVVRVDDLQELRDKVAATQKQLESLYLDEHVSAGMTREHAGASGSEGEMPACSLCSQAGCHEE